MTSVNEQLAKIDATVSEVNNTVSRVISTYDSKINDAVTTTALKNNVTTNSITLDGININADLKTGLDFNGFKLTPSDYVIEYDELMAKFLAISMDINPVVVFSGVGALANSNRPRAELLIRKMWHYLFNVLPGGEGSNLRAMRFRELNIIYDNFKLLYEKSSGITKDGCEHMLNVIKTTLSAQHSDGINQVLGVGRAFGMGGKNLFFQDGFESKFTVGRMFYSTLFTTALTSNPLCLAKLTDYNNLPLEDYINF